MEKIFRQNKNLIIATAFIIITYIISRLINLTELQIFTDEAIYIRWAQIGAQDANWRFISLTDGKQPLFTWMMMVLFKLLKSFDPLFVGRLASVISGMFGIFGIFFLTQILFNNKTISFIAASIYLISPYTLMYDRVALYDSLVSALSLWSLYFSVLLVKTLRLDVALILGLVLGAGMLNKTSGFISLYLLPATLLLFDIKQKHLKRNILKWFGLAFISAVLSQIIYSVLRLSPFFHIVAEKNTVFVYPLSEWITHPFRFLLGNLNGLFDWTINYLTWPVFVISLFGFFAFWSKPKEKLLLFIYWIVPFVGLATFGKVLYPRFVLFMAMPLIIGSSISIYRIFRQFKNNLLLKFLLVFILLIPSFYTSYKIISDPYKAPIPKADKGQFMDNYFAGGGIRESVDFFSDIIKDREITVYTEGTFGLLPFALEIYLVDNPNITIKAIWPLPKEIPQEFIQSALIMPTYLILNETQTIPEKWPLQFISSYQKGSRQDISLRIFRIIPESQIAKSKI